MAAYLECWDGEAWSPRFILFTDYGSGPSNHRYGPHVVDGVGLPGPGPEPNMLPEQLEPGWYRIRKELGREEIAGYVEVRRP